MSGVFKAGQLVKPCDWLDEDVDLFSIPGGARPIMGTTLPRIISRLVKHDIALVIATERSDGGSVYVLGPNGGGWAFGAFIEVVP
jgi:hypothetical protein